nr:hypothetical protein I302_03747 [Kwoniella bestiolae CBS 10118]OCF26070.1 hypothetical protein I302_03747 [Kwoniella bestiolae CBS 10118]
MTTPHSSSPLNPNSHARSSSPLSSPTPGPSSSSRPFQSFSLPSPSLKSPSTPLKSTRYIRPSKRSSLPSSSSTTDLFSEGTTPMEGQMWREKFTRRVEAREKRKADRTRELDKRRGTGVGGREMSVEEEEAEDRRAQEDDEEIFRRLVILQRKKSQHASLVSHEQETGGSDPLTPEFWEDELDHLQREERELMDRLDHPMMSSPPPSDPGRSGKEEELEEWQIQAALAEQEELDLEEMRLADQVEQAYYARHISPSMQDQIRHSENHGMGMDVDMDLEMDTQVDWEAFDSMDIE